MNAYLLADRGTFKNQGDLAILVQGDKRLYNQYGVILVNPDKHPTVKKDLGQTFIGWLVSPEGQQAVAGHKISDERLSSRMGSKRVYEISKSRHRHFAHREHRCSGPAADHGTLWPLSME